MSYAPRNVPFVQGMYLGMGVNMVDGNSTSTVFKEFPATKSPQSNFNLYSACVQTAENYSSAVEALGGAEGQAWTEGGQVSVSTSAHFLRSLKVSQQSLTFLSYKMSTTQLEAPDSAALAALVLPPGVATQIVKDPEGFLAEYGTHVITQFIYGGSFLASMMVEASSQAELTEVATALSASVKDFEASGKVDASFMSNLASVAQSHKTTVQCTGNGVNPPSFEPTNVDAIQDYIDGTGQYQSNGFVDQLGGGTKIVAVCEPWENLQCVTQLEGYKSGSLSPSVDLGILDNLRYEYQRLDYALQTAKSMQATNCFVGSASANALSDDVTGVINAQGKIEGLQFADLQQLSSTSLGQYIAATGYLTDLSAIASGRAGVAWTYGLDDAFKPNTQSAPNKSISGSTATAFPVTDGSAHTVATANHEDGTINLGYVYEYVTVPPGQPAPSSLQEQVQLQGHIEFVHTGGSKDVYVGDPVSGNETNQPSNAVWNKYVYDHIGCWLE